MMNNHETSLKITHETTYAFDSKVLIDPHHLRFKPGVTRYNTLTKTDLTIFPVPIGLSEQIDAENNLVYFCWFDGLHSTLSILSETTVLLHEKNPMDFIIFPSVYSDLPFSYSDRFREPLHASLQAAAIDKPLIDYGNQLLEKSKHKTLHFISDLTRQIQTDFTLASREKGEPFAADKTFQLKTGSCRDLSWMQIQLLRYFGIAARFVSGYYFIESESSEHDLHGWVEVYLPGAGWIGFDPSHGIIAGSSHIPVCCSAHYQNTMPVTGSFRGRADSAMQTSLSIDIIEPVADFS